MNTPYTPVPLTPSDEEKSTPVAPTLSEAELCVVKKASRVVIVLCLFQLALSVMTGGLIMLCASAVFVSLGFVGVAKKRTCLLTAHFVYSLILYILTLVGVVTMILYCVDCKLWTYLVALCVVLIQAIGMRHSRILIALLKKQNGTQGSCCFKSRCNKNVTENVVQPEVVAEMNSIPMYSLPAHQFMTMPMQMQPMSMNNGTSVQYAPYFPVQSVQYPIMQHPTFITVPLPNNNNTQQASFSINPSN